jgi:ABC-type antimicrobial peptide transport system permease subunit
VRIVVTASLAKRLFGTLDIVGRPVRVGSRNLDDGEIVGVVGDVRLGELEGPADEAFFQPRPVPGTENAVTVLFRTTAGPESMAAVRSALEGALPGNPVPGASPLRDRIDEQLGEQRLFAQLLTLFSTMAVLLAAVGLYGVVAFAVAGRKREFGIRAALGADGRRLGVLVLRSAVVMVGLGISTGLIAAMSFSQVIQSRLFGVEAVDVAAYIGATALLASAALLACWMPVRSATRTDPVATLRKD